jgi:hypothetical protein
MIKLLGDAQMRVQGIRILMRMVFAQSRNAHLVLLKELPLFVVISLVSNQEMFVLLHVPMVKHPTLLVCVLLRL